MNGNDLLEHIEKCDSCIKLDEFKEYSKKMIKEIKENIKFIDKLQGECFNES